MAGACDSTERPCVVDSAAMTFTPAAPENSRPSALEQNYLRLDERRVAHTYAPLPVIASSGAGAWLTDVTGRRYLDMLAAYSAMNFGHGNPRIVAAASAQLQDLTL